MNETKNFKTDAKSLMIRAENPLRAMDNPFGIQDECFAGRIA